MTLLPTKPTGEQRAAYVARIKAMYVSATPAQLSAGTGWYPEAHLIASECPAGTRAGAGVLAALSANKSWSENVRLARQGFGGRLAGHFADALGKASSILAGSDPMTVLPMGLKTGQFFLCIADPADPDAVVIDRHAHDIAAGMKYGNAERGLDNGTRYASIADAYRVAGKDLGIIASVVQAVTWTVITDMARYARAITGLPDWGRKGNDDGS